MIKSHKVKREIETDEVDDILCNKCGHSCYPSTKFAGAYGLIETEVSGGYESIAGIGDMTIYKFSLCEHCLVALFKTFTHDPFVEEVIPDEFI